MFDGSMYLKQIVQVFESLPVLEYRSTAKAFKHYSQSFGLS
jgi:hypothetical protein